MHVVRSIPLDFRPPDYTSAAREGDVVRIARISMYEEVGSIELWATRSGTLWHYDLTNTFGWHLEPGRRASRGTLTLAELIALLEGSTVAGGHDACLMAPVCGGFNLLPEPATLCSQRRHLRTATQFPRPHSQLYPHLRDWYTAQHEEWLDHHLIRCLELRHEA